MTSLLRTKNGSGVSESRSRASARGPAGGRGQGSPCGAREGLGWCRAGPSAHYLPVPRGSSSWDMEMRIPSWRETAAVRPALPSRGRGWAGPGGRAGSGPHPLLLGLHLLLQHLRHVAHGQDHMVHTCLCTEGRAASAGAAQGAPAPAPGDPGSYRSKGLHLVQQDGLVAEIHERLRRAQRQRPQPRPVAAHQNQGLHGARGRRPSPRHRGGSAHRTGPGQTRHLGSTPRPLCRTPGLDPPLASR